MIPPTPTFVDEELYPIISAILKFRFEFCGHQFGGPEPAIRKLVIARLVFQRLSYEASEMQYKSPGNIFMPRRDLQRRSIEIAGIVVECDE